MGYAPNAGLASYWQRIGSYLIDILVFAPLYVAVFVIMTTGDTEIVRCDDTFGSAYCEQPTGGTMALAYGIGLLVIPLSIAYAVWQGRTGKTLGKLAVGIRTVDIHRLDAIGGWRGVGRYLITVPLGICCLGTVLDLLWPLWDDKKQTLHDKTVSAVVVRKNYAQVS